MKTKVVDEVPSVSLELVGINKASTFTGFCDEHDAEIFRPIETKPLNLSDSEQLFLIAYRSLTREVHATMEGAAKVQATYLDLVEKGKVPRDAPSAVGLEATQHLMKAYAAWQYRHHFFDQCFSRTRFADIRHTRFNLEDEPPVLAASSFFSMDFKPWGQPFAALIVNVIPTSADRTAVIFSYAQKHARKAVKYISNVVKSKGKTKKYELSYLIINRAENFFLSPRIVNKWTNEKKIAIEKAFLTDLLGPKDAPRLPEFNLFE